MTRFGAAGWVALASAVAFAGAATPAAGQIGAIAAAAAVSGANQTGEYALSGAPVFSESGLILTEGWTANGFGVSTTQTVPFFDGFMTDEYEFTATQVTVGAFAAVGERAMIGAVLSPYVSGEFTFSDNDTRSVSGLGDLSIIGRIALTESADGRTRLAASGSVLAAIGDEEVSSGTTGGSAGLGVSHQLDARTSVHGGGSVSFSSDDSDTQDIDEGGSGFSFSGAVVRQVSPTAWISGELLGSAASGEWIMTLAPAGRIKANDNMFIDLGLAFGLASSDGAIPLDVGLAAGFTYVPGS